MQKLKISTNKRYFIMEDGTPFIWIADTAWTMPQRLKWDDVDYYMKKRKSQGFTVLQIVALDPEQDIEMRNPAGTRALNKNDLLSPNEAYFTYLDFILDKAEEYDFHVLLLPAWGQLVVGHCWSGRTYEKTVHEENAYEYGYWIGNRYKNRKNVIWCLGGDRQPIHLGISYKDVWRRMAEGLAKGITGLDLKYNQPDKAWEDLLITYHSCYEMQTGECSTMSYWTEEEAWISFIMLQSGHGLHPKNYEMVKKEYDRNKRMPVWDGEPAYELMPTSWPVIKEFHGAGIVRKRAYWSLFAGSFGHTYGHSCVWCMVSEKEKDQVRTHTWFQALESPGSLQIKVLRDFLESRDLSHCIPAQEMLLIQQSKENDILDEHVQACREIEGKFACIYFPSGGKEKIWIKEMDGNEFLLWWFNPKDGKCYDFSNVQTTNPMNVVCTDDWIEVTTPTLGKDNDWILVLDAKELSLPVPGLEQVYGDMGQNAELKKVFEW